MVRAIQYTNELGANTLALVGFDDGRLRQIARHTVLIDEPDMQLVEGLHLSFGHRVAQYFSQSRR